MRLKRPLQDSLFDPPEPRHVTPPVCYVAVIECNSVIPVMRDAVPRQIPGTSMYVAFRETTRGLPAGAAVHFVETWDGLKQPRAEAVPFVAWRRIPFDIADKAVVKCRFRAFASKSAAEHELAKRRMS